MSKFINENRLFKKIKCFFERPEMVFIEIAQNSTRAGATNLDLSLVDNTLTAIDNGSGCTDPMALLQLSGSDWSEEVENEQNPAGWGLFALYAISSTVKFVSKFGSMTVNCKRFLEDAEYRENLPQAVDKNEHCDGFAIYAEIADKDILGRLNNDHKNDLGWFPLELSYNENKIERIEADRLYGNYPIITEYEGNRVYIDTEKISCYGDSSNTDISVVWYGIVIRPKRYTYDAIVMDVKRGSPLNPVLPYRDTIKKDSKDAAFREFVRKRIVEYCTKKINNNGKKDKMFEKMVELMSYFASQEELDKLNMYGVMKRDCGYQDVYGCDNSVFVAVSRRQKIQKNEYLAKVTINGKNSNYDEYDNITLPPNTVTSIKKYKGSPSWLNVETKYINIEIETEGETIYYGDYTWTKAKSILCAGKELKAMFINCTFYYTDPDAIKDIDYAVFTMHVYYDDGDSWDTQLDYYNETVGVALNKIRGSYRKYDLFKSLCGALSWDEIEKIALIKIDNREVVIKKNDGSDIKLALAA